LSEQVERLSVSAGGDFRLGADALIDVSGKGYSNGNGPAPGHIGAGGCHGGQGAGSGGANYGSILVPATAGSGGRSGDHYGDLHGGGIAHLTVGHALVCDGVIRARGSDRGDRDGAGGSIRIVAGTLSGSGTIDARGSNAYRSGGGGRVAVRLTTGTDFGSVVMHAYGGSTAAIDSRAAAGTVYKQTAADEPDGGVVIVANNNQDADVEKTWLPATAASTEDLSLTRWTIQSYGEVRMVTNVTLAALTLNANGYLDLNGYTNTVSALTIQGSEIEPETYTAADLGALVTDSSAGDTGRVIVLSPLPAGTVLLLN
jgi:hypothetical protein